MVFAQVIGLIGIVLLIVAFQVNDRRKILLLQTASCLVWGLYYLLMGAYTAAGLISLGIVRNYLFERYQDEEWVFQMVIGMYVIATAATWKDWTSILALIGITIATTAMWQKKPQHIRATLTAATPFWLTYNFLTHSYVGIAGDLVTFASVVVGIIRFDLPTYAKKRRLARQEQISEYTEFAET